MFQIYLIFKNVALLVCCKGFYFFFNSKVIYYVA